MKSFAQYLHSIRSENQLSAKELAALWGIHPSLISRYEKGDRLPTAEQIDDLVSQLQLDRTEVLNRWYAEQITEMIPYADLNVKDILVLAETRMEYLKSSKAFDLPKLKADIQHELQILDELREEWHRRKPSTGIQLEKMEDYFSGMYTYESNRIEGNTMTYMETFLVISEGLTIGGKSMKEHLETINHASAIDYVKELIKDKRFFTERDLLSIHNLVLHGIDRENAGVYRRLEVRIMGSDHIPPQPYLVAKLMEDFFIQYNRMIKEVHPVILAAEMHERLVTIHPFIDGNGRTARLIMNLILLQNGFTIAILKGDEDSRKQYYSALEKVQVDADPTPFYRLIVDRCKASLKEHIELT